MRVLSLLPALFLALTPVAATAQEPVVKSKIVAAGLFKNGLAVIKREVVLPGPGTFVLENLPEPVHGTWWVDSTSPVETMVKRTSTPLRSPGRSTSFAPAAAKGSAFDLVRFQMEMSKPALASRSAMGKPMRPRPIQPALSFPSTILDPCLSRDSDHLSSPSWSRRFTHRFSYRFTAAIVCIKDPGQAKCQLNQAWSCPRKHERAVLSE